MSTKILTRQRALVVIVVVIAATSGGRARAEFPDGDLIKYTLGAGVYYDDNVYRLPNNVSPPAETGSTSRSDTIFLLNAGANVNKEIGRQQFLLGGSIVRSFYTEHDQQDYTLYNFAGTWRWQIGSQLGGDVGYRQNQYPRSFLDVRAIVPSKRTVGQPFITAGYQFHPSWEARIGYQFTDVTNSNPVFALSNIEESQYQGGVRYTTAFGNKVDALYRYTDGDRPNLPDLPFLSTKSYNQNDFGVNVASWEFSGRSRAFGYLFYTQRSYPQFSQRDYSGPTWNLTYAYMPTGKTAINISFYRIIGAFTDETTNYIETTGVALNPTWQATGKLGFALLASYNDRNYKGDPGIITDLLDLQKRDDKIWTAGLTATYAIIRTVTANVYYTWTKRDSNFATRDFTDNTVGAGLQWTF